MWDGRERGRSRAKIRNQSIPYPPTYHVPHAGTRLSLRPFPSFCGRSAHERESVSAVILSAHQSSRIAAQLSSFSCRCATERETEAGKAEICSPIFLFLIRELNSSPSIFPCLVRFRRADMSWMVCLVGDGLSRATVRTLPCRETRLNSR
jgi:hypothetical protein